jgi:cytoskeleton protein RodZ
MSEFDLPASQPEDSPASYYPSPGQKLKNIREELGLSYGRVADALHITAHYVKALENDQYDKLPGKTFVKGYIRSYARLVEADVDDIMLCYQRFSESLVETKESEANVIRAKKAYDQNVRWMVWAAAIIVLVVGISWWFARGSQADAAMAVSGTGVIAEIKEMPMATPLTAVARMSDLRVMTNVQIPVTDGRDAEMPGEHQVAWEAVERLDANVMLVGGGDIPAPAKEFQPAQFADAAVVVGDTTLPDYTVIEQDDSRMVRLDSGGEDLLEVSFTGASWIEVDNADDTRLYNDLLDSGDDLSIRGKAPFNVLIGDANVVDVTFNSQEIEVTMLIRTDNSARIVLEPETN